MIVNESEKAQTALFMIIRNNFVMPTGLKLKKDMAEINRMSYAAMLEIMNSTIDFDSAYKSFSEGRKKYWEEQENGVKTEKERKDNG